MILLKSFISRIEDCNRRIKPILIEEAEILKVKLQNFEIEMKELYPIYKELREQNQNYLKEKGLIRNKIIRDKKISYREVDEKELEELFRNKFPEYGEFFQKYSDKKKEYDKLAQQISNTKTVLNKILKYNEKIKLYFEK